MTTIGFVGAPSVDDATAVTHFQDRQFPGGGGNAILIFRRAIVPLSYNHAEDPDFTHRSQLRTLPASCSRIRKARYLRPFAIEHGNSTCMAGLHRDGVTGLETSQ